MSNWQKEQQIKELKEEIERNNRIADKYLRLSMEDTPEGPHYHQVKEERYRQQARDAEAKLKSLL